VLSTDEDWHALVAGTRLQGPARQLAEHAAFIGYSDGVLSLSLSDDDEFLRAAPIVKLVADALTPLLGTTPQLRFEARAASAETLHQRKERVRDERQAQAEQTFMGDPDVQRLMSQYGAQVVPDSIRPLNEG